MEKLSKEEFMNKKEIEFELTDQTRDLIWDEMQRTGESDEEVVSRLVRDNLVGKSKEYWQQDLEQIKTHHKLLKEKTREENEK